MELKDWISLVATFFAAIAAIASWVAIFYQYKRDKVNKEAIIAPSIKHINTKIDNILSDWTNEDNRIPKKFSKVTLPIWNYGNTPVFNVKYSYLLDNISELEYKLEGESKGNHNIHINKNELYIEHETGSQFRHIQSYIRSLDGIQPKDKNEIGIPDYFLILLNDYFLPYPDSEDRIRPILLLNIYYDDINFKSWHVQYKVFMGNTYKFDGSSLNTYLQYCIHKKKKKIKNKNPYV